MVLHKYWANPLVSAYERSRYFLRPAGDRRQAMRGVPLNKFFGSFLNLLNDCNLGSDEHLMGVLTIRWKYRAIVWCCVAHRDGGRTGLSSESLWRYAREARCLAGRGRRASDRGITHGGSTSAGRIADLSSTFVVHRSIEALRLPGGWTRRDGLGPDIVLRANASVRGPLKGPRWPLCGLLGPGGLVIAGSGVEQGGQDLFRTEQSAPIEGFIGDLAEAGVIPAAIAHGDQKGGDFLWLVAVERV